VSPDCCTLTPILDTDTDIMLLTGTLGRGCSLSVSLGGRSVRSIEHAGQGFALRLDRPGFRPLHFQSRPSSALHKSSRSLNYPTKYSRLSCHSARRLSPLLRVLSTQTPLPPKPDLPEVSPFSFRGSQLTRRNHQKTQSISVNRPIPSPTPSRSPE